MKCTIPVVLPYSQQVGSNSNKMEEWRKMALVDYTDSDEDAEPSAPLTSGKSRGRSPQLRQHGALNIIANEPARLEIESIAGTAVFSDDFIASCLRPGFHGPSLVRRHTLSLSPFCQE